MSISSIQGRPVSFSSNSPSSVGSTPQSPKAKLDSLVSDITQKLASGDIKGVVEGIKKLCDTLGVDAKKVLEALGMDEAGAEQGAEGAEGAEGAGGAKGAGDAGGAEGAAPAGGAEGAEGAGELLEMLLKMLKQNPALAKKLLENPGLLKKLAQNPELLKQVAQNPQALQSMASGAPPELAGISQFQSAPARAPVSLS